MWRDGAKRVTPGTKEHGTRRRLSRKVKKCAVASDAVKIPGFTVKVEKLLKKEEENNLKTKRLIRSVQAFHIFNFSFFLNSDRRRRVQFKDLLQWASNAISVGQSWLLARLMACETVGETNFILYFNVLVDVRARGCVRAISFKIPPRLTLKNRKECIAGSFRYGQQLEQ
ncbi:hypothetical protein OUZ56_002675 [Daphnia magna]|uniref:Uncharacterized protein n=1 Tax=Daphnia magna TaxID=35525 RepID=A0ABR0A6F4_9CRUS|nr:hypothetical protein OUZ56_002675 [Daphnia magna]